MRKFIRGRLFLDYTFDEGRKVFRYCGGLNRNWLFASLLFPIGSYFLIGLLHVFSHVAVSFAGLMTNFLAEDVLLMAAVRLDLNSLVGGGVTLVVLRSLWRRSCLFSYFIESWN